LRISYLSDLSIKITFDSLHSSSLQESKAAAGYILTCITALYGYSSPDQLSMYTAD